jgi:hypothetical protein
MVGDQSFPFSHRDELRAKKNRKNLDRNVGMLFDIHFRSIPFTLIIQFNSRTTQCADIDACLQAVTGSSSTANFVEGLCKYFISHPDDPDSLDVMWATIGVLENLHQHAQSVVDNVIEKCGMGSVVHRIPYFESVGFSQLWMMYSLMP